MQDLVKHLKPVDDSSIFEHSPWKETYFAVRAILPLLIVLVFLVVVVLRKVIFFCFYFAVTAILPLLIKLVFLVFFVVFGSCAEDASAGILVLHSHTHTHTHIAVAGILVYIYIYIYISCVKKVSGGISCGKNGDAE